MIQTLIRDSFTAPKRAARRIIDLDLPFGTGVLALAGTVSASVVLLFLTTGPLARPDAPPGLMPFSPLSLAALAIGIMALFSVALTLSGRPFGGQGNFEQAFMLMAWLQVLQLGLQVIQVVLALVALALAGIFGIATVVITLWLLISFVQELHRLASLGQATLVTLLALVGLALAISLVLTLFGGPAVQFVPT